MLRFCVTAKSENIGGEHHVRDDKSIAGQR